MFTVKDLLELDVMKSAVLIAGEKGINNEVSFATIMETPDVASFMKGGEFMISAGFAFNGDGVDCRKVIDDFANKNISALGINVGRYLDTIPVDIIDECNNCNLPLIILPKNMPYMDIMLPVWDRTINLRMTDTIKQKNFYNDLLDVVLSEKGFVGISNTLSVLIDNPVFLTDGIYNILSGSMTSHDLLKEYGIKLRDVVNRIKNTWNRRNLQNEVNFQRLDYAVGGEEKISVVTMPVLVNSVASGNLFILELNHNVSEKDLTALKDAVKIIGIEMLKQKAGLDIQNRVQSELLEDLLSGYYHDESVFYRHVERMNVTVSTDGKPIFTVGTPMAMAFINLVKIENIAKTDNIKFPYDIKSKIRNVINEYCSNHLAGVLLSSRSDCVICLFSLKEGGTIHDFDNLQDFMKRKVSGKYCYAVGISDIFYEIKDIKNAYECAKIAANSRTPGSTLQVIYYNQMGVYLLLNEIKNLPAAKAFKKLYLQPLLDYDNKDGELIKTLEAYFANNGNLRKTSDALYVHKNSVIYRLNKVQQLTGLDLNNSEDKFNLQLGLYLLRVD
ncbi:MAG: PucR family transcriptional regulator [Bacillota bacterium]|jgi:purine catabolism regulator